MSPFWRGFASVLDIGGTLFQPSSLDSFERDDAKALQGDWQAVMGDLEKAIGPQRGPSTVRQIEAQAKHVRRELF